LNSKLDPAEALEIRVGLDGIGLRRHIWQMTKRREPTAGLMTRLPAKVGSFLSRATPGEPKLDGRSPEPIDSEHRDAVIRGLTQAHRSEFVSEADVKEAFRRFRP